MTSELMSQLECVESTVTGRGRPCGADTPFMQRRIGTPVLDRADLRHLVDQPEQRLERISQPHRRRVLEQDDWRSVARGDGPQMGERHLGAELAAHRHAVRWEYQEA